MRLGLGHAVCAGGGVTARARVCACVCGRVGGWEAGTRTEARRDDDGREHDDVAREAEDEAQQQRRQRRGDVELGEEHVEAQRRRLEQRHALLLREELGGRGEDAGLQLLVDCNCAQGRRSLRGEAVPSRLEAAQGDRGQGRV